MTARHEKSEMEDGRHNMRWFLIDRMAHEHLAVEGEQAQLAGCSRCYFYYYRSGSRLHSHIGVRAGRRRVALALPGNARGSGCWLLGVAISAGSAGG